MPELDYYPRSIQHVTQISAAKKYENACARVDLFGAVGVSNYLTAYYDITDDNWYTDAVLTLPLGVSAAASMPVANTWYHTLRESAGLNFGNRYWIDWRDPHNAGFRPQFRTYTLCDAVAGRTVSSSLRIQRGNDDSNLGAATTFFAITVTTGVGAGQFSGDRGTWQTPPAMGALVDGFMLECFAKVDGVGASGNLQGGHFEMRWRDGSGV